MLSILNLIMAYFKHIHLAKVFCTFMVRDLSLGSHSYSDSEIMELKRSYTLPPTTDTEPYQESV